MLKTLKQKNETLFAAGLYLILTLLIVWPFWRRGFVLSLDMVFTPHYDIDFAGLASGYRTYNSLPLDFLLKGLSFILGGGLVQKLLLTFVFFSAGFFMFRVLPLKSFTARFTAGALYLFNPFVHQRLLAGHWNFLLAYAFTPLVIWGFYKSFTDESFPTWKAAALWTLVIVFNVHHAFILLVVWGVMFGVRLVFDSKKKTLLKRQWHFIGWMLLMNSFWIIPFGLNHGHELIFYNVDHLTAFATRPDPDQGMLVNLLGMYGFWREYGSLELSKFALGKTWPLFVVVFVSVCWVGILRLIKVKQRRWIGVSLLLVFFLSLLLSMGSSGQLWWLNQWIFEYVPGFKGMREPQKFLALLPLVYSISLAFALEKSKRMQWLNSQKINWNHLVGFFLLAILIIYNFAFMHGGGLRTSQYPQGWYQLQDSIEKEDVILSLPFKQYHFSPLAGRDLLDPVPKFFARQTVISSRNSQKVGLTSEKQNPLDDWMDVVAEDPQVFFELLAQLEVDYIVLQKQGEFELFYFLNNHPQVKTFSEDDFSILYSVHL